MTANPTHMVSIAKKIKYGLSTKRFLTIRISFFNIIGVKNLKTGIFLKFTTEKNI